MFPFLPNTVSFGRLLCLSAMLANTLLSTQLTMVTTMITTTKTIATITIRKATTMTKLSIIALIHIQMVYHRIPCTNNHQDQSIPHHECLFGRIDYGILLLVLDNLTSLFSLLFSSPEARTRRPYCS